MLVLNQGTGMEEGFIMNFILSRETLDTKEIGYQERIPPENIKLAREDWFCSYDEPQQELDQNHD